MNSSESIPSLPETVITPLCEPFANQADWILELYEMTRRTDRHPGKCLSCFYALLESASEEKSFALAPLKRWIEDNTIIGVRTGNQVYTTLPVKLDQPSLNEFCHHAMHQVREDRINPTNQTITLELHFKANAKAA